MVAKPNHTLQRVWRPISYASTTVLEQTWQLEPKATERAVVSRVSKRKPFIAKGLSARVPTTIFFFGSVLLGSSPGRSARQSAE